MAAHDDGTALKCLCCETATMAKSFPDRGEIEIRDRQHGRFHTGSWSLTELVKMLDPHGTSFRPVQIGTTGNYV